MNIYEIIEFPSKKLIESFDLPNEDNVHIENILQVILELEEDELLNEYIIPLQFLIEQFDDKTFDILINSILTKQATNQSSQDDMVI